MPLIREVPFAVFVAKFVASEQGTGFVTHIAQFSRRMSE
jgi:hypothetical protein